MCNGLNPTARGLAETISITKILPNWIKIKILKSERNQKNTSHFRINFE